MKHEITPHWQVVREADGLPRLKALPVLDAKNGWVRLDPMHAPRGYTQFPASEWCRTEAEAVQRELAKARESVAYWKRGLTEAEGYEGALVLLLELKSKGPDTSAALRDLFRRRRPEAPEFLDPNQPQEPKKP